MTIRGSLEEASLPDFLQLLSLGRKTGRLSVSDKSHVGYVYLESGRIVSATLPNRPDRIGDILLKNGEITPEQLRQAIETQGLSRDQRVGAILVEQGVITSAVLERYVRRQIEEAIYFLLTWQRGDVVFEKDIGPEEDEILVSIDPDRILLEGARRTDEWTVIEREIPSLDAVFILDEDRLNQADMPRTEELNRIVALIDGTRNANQIIDDTGLSPFEVGKVLYDLVTAGCAHPSRRSAEGQTPAAVAESGGENGDGRRNGHFEFPELERYLAKEGEFADKARRREAGKHIVDCKTCTARLAKVNKRRTGSMPATAEVDTDSEEQPATEAAPTTESSPAATTVPGVEAVPPNGGQGGEATGALGAAEATASVEPVPAENEPATEAIPAVALSEAEESTSEETVEFANHLREAEMYRYVRRTGEFADDDIRREAGLHIFECPECAARVQQLRRESHETPAPTLRPSVPEAPAPAPAPAARPHHLHPEELRRYVAREGEFADKEKRKVAGLHIADCRECAERLKTLDRQRKSQATGAVGSEEVAAATTQPVIIPVEKGAARFNMPTPAAPVEPSPSAPVKEEKAQERPAATAAEAPATPADADVTAPMLAIETAPVVLDPQVLTPSEKAEPSAVARDVAPEPPAPVVSPPSPSAEKAVPAAAPASPEEPKPVVRVGQHLNYAKLRAYAERTSEFADDEVRRYARRHIMNCAECTEALRRVRRDLREAGGLSAERASPQKHQGQADRRKRDRRRARRRMLADRRTSENPRLSERRVMLRRVLADRRIADRRSLGVGIINPAPAAQMAVGPGEPVAASGPIEPGAPPPLTLEPIIPQASAPGPPSAPSPAAATARSPETGRTEPTAPVLEPVGASAEGRPAAGIGEPRSPAGALLRDRPKTLAEVVGEPIGQPPVKRRASVMTSTLPLRESRPAARRAPSWRIAAVIAFMALAGSAGWFGRSLLAGSREAGTPDQSLTPATPEPETAGEALALLPDSTAGSGETLADPSADSPQLAAEAPSQAQAGPREAATPPSPPPVRQPPAREPEVTRAAPEPTPVQPARTEEPPPTRQQPPPAVEPEPPPAPTPTTAFVAGSVIDPSGSALADAVVRLGAGRGEVRTDASGQFRLDAVPPGRGTMTVELMGYVSVQRELTTAAGDSARIDLTLQPVPRPRATEADPEMASGQWALSDRETAERILGIEFPTVPGLWTETIAISTGRRPRVRVTQLTETGERVALVISRPRPEAPIGTPHVTAMRVIAGTAAYPVTTGTASFGSLLITAKTSLPADSLQAFLRSLQTEEAPGQ